MPRSIIMANPATMGVQNEGMNPGAQSVETDRRDSATTGTPMAAVAGRDGAPAEKPNELDTSSAEAVAHADKDAVIHSDLMKLVPGPPASKEQAEREKEVLADDANLERTAMQGVTVSLTGMFKKNKDKRSVAEKELDEQRDEDSSEAPTVA